MKTSSTSRSAAQSWRFRLLVMLTLLMYVSSSVGVLVGQGGMPGCRCAQGDPGPNGCCCRARLQIAEAEITTQPAIPSCCATAPRDNTPVDCEPTGCEPDGSTQAASPSSDCCSVKPAPVSSCCSTGSTSSSASTGSGCCGTSDPSAPAGLYAMCRCGSQHPSGLICNSDPRLLAQESGLNGSENNSDLPPSVFVAYIPPLLLPESPPPQQLLV